MFKMILLWEYKGLEIKIFFIVILNWYIIN